MNHMKVTIGLLLAMVQSTYCFADIVGGDDVAPTDDIAHTTVALYQQSSPESGALCTATLIAKNIAVTAAHCVEHGVDHMGIITGEEIESSDRSVLRVVDAEISKQWSEGNLAGQDAGDIALIRFEGKLPKGYHAAHMLPKKVSLQKGDQVILAGYGISNAMKKTGAGTLRKTEVSVQDPQFGKTEILLDQRNGSGACHGDSGGPAFVESNGKYYLMGVTSRGYPVTAPDDCHHEVVYTRVNAYKNWISQTAKELQKGHSAVR